jgi:ribosome-associated toxin RatA of RatAB toxin-antitoxin module
MPQVTLDMQINAPAGVVWRAVTDVERYPESMRSVRAARILDAPSATTRRTEWSVSLKGSILEWEEDETLDPERMVMRFRQLSGDMEKFDGEWTVDPVDAERSTVRLTVEFEIGIPLLADMLNPVAQRSLRENCVEMLRGIETQSTGRVVDAAARR